MRAALLQFEGVIGHSFASIYNAELGRIELPDGHG
jgi:hypothetical protein